jgi:nicotinamide phosphoribosyltransferase
VYKDPITDPGKASKKGRLDLVRDPNTKEFITYSLGLAQATQSSELVEVYRNGELIKEWSFAEIRARSELA